jgi:hypothetical protein
MRTLIDFSVLQEYNEKVLLRGDKLSALSTLVDWNAFLMNCETKELAANDLSWKDA